MPGPYSFPTDRVTGGPSPASDVNALGAALNEAAPLATPNVLALRDANGRMQAEDPVDVEDVATKGWVQTQNGFLIPKDLVNAKGDLIVATAADTVTRLAVGSAGTVLKADPGAAEGMSWGATSEGIGEYVGSAEGVAARWNTSPASPSGQSVGSGTADMKVAPLPIYGPCKLRSFTFQITAAGDAGSLIHWWLFEPSGTHGSVPDTLVQAFAGVSGSATGQVTITPSVPIDLAPGYYMFLVGGSNITTTSPSVQASASTMGQELAYRTRSGARLDLFTRGGTIAAGINVDAGAPASINWNFSSTAPYLIDSSGGRFPLVLLDLIPA